MVSTILPPPDIDLFLFVFSRETNTSSAINLSFLLPKLQIAQVVGWVEGGAVLPENQQHF